MSTVRTLLQQGITQLELANLSDATTSARLLLLHILAINRATLYAYPDREVTQEQEQRFFTLIERRLQHEPIAYILGQEEFYGRDFIVDRRVLIPRPETELLVEIALDILHKRIDSGDRPVVADIGTGSGIIPITLALEEPRLPYLYACDISPDALDVARINCQRHAIESRVYLLQGDLLEPLPEPIDLLLANLPYVGTEETSIMTSDVLDYEPHLALFSGSQGVDLLQRLFAQIEQRSALKAGGSMVLEIGYAQADLLMPMLRQHWPEAHLSYKKDYAGWNRVIQMTL